MGAIEEQCKHLIDRTDIYVVGIRCTPHLDLFHQRRTFKPHQNIYKIFFYIDHKKAVNYSHKEFFYELLFITGFLWCFPF
jgi:hypothetical protein